MFRAEYADGHRVGSKTYQQPNKKMLLYTVCFTKKGIQPENNKYISMFFIWLRYLEVYGGVTATDTICVIMDSETKRYIDTFQTVNVIQIPYTSIEFEQPSTAQEGTQYRYRIYESGLITDKLQVCYMDVDMLIIKDIHWIEHELTQNSNALLVYPEYTLRHFTYLGEQTEEDMIFFDEFPDVYTTHPGMTSTFFAFSGLLLNEPFQELISKMKTSEIEHYTLDQPFFNRMILWHSYKKQTFEISFVQKKAIAYNTLRNRCSEEACIINYCGEPGNQEFHWMKMFMAVLSEIE